MSRYRDSVAALPWTVFLPARLFCLGLGFEIFASSDLQNSSFSSLISHPCTVWPLFAFRESCGRARRSPFPPFAWPQFRHPRAFSTRFEQQFAFSAQLRASLGAKKKSCGARAARLFARFPPCVPSLPPFVPSRASFHPALFRPVIMEDDAVVDRFLDSAGAEVLTIRRKSIQIKRAAPHLLATVADAFKGRENLVSLPFKSAEGGIIGATISHRNDRKLLIHRLIEGSSSKGDKKTELIAYQERVDAVVLQSHQEALEAQSIIRLLATACPREPDRSKRVLAVLNPHGGRGALAKDITYGVVVKLLEAAGIQVDVVESQYAGHAIDVGLQFDPDVYEGLVLTGGDGTLYEFVSGLLSRPSWAELARRTPILAIKCGTNNAVAMGVRTTLPHYGAFCVIKRLLRPLDAMLVVNGEGVRGLSLCVAAFGVASTVALESEATRESFGLYRYEYLKARGAYRVASGKTRYTCSLETSGDIALTDEELALYSASYPPWGGCTESGSNEEIPPATLQRLHDEAAAGGAGQAVAGERKGDSDEAAVRRLSAMHQLVPTGSVPASLRVVRALRGVPGALPEPAPKAKTLRLYPCFLSQFSRRPIAKTLDKLRSTFLPCAEQGGVIPWPNDTIFDINRPVRPHSAISNKKQRAGQEEDEGDVCAPPIIVRRVGLVNMLAPTAAVVEAVLDLQKETEEREKKKKEEQQGAGGTPVLTGDSASNKRIAQALCASNTSALSSVDDGAFSPLPPRNETASSSSSSAAAGTPSGLAHEFHPSRHMRAKSAREVLERHVVPKQHINKSQGALGKHSTLRRHAALQSATLQDLHEIEEAEPSGKALALVAAELYKAAAVKGATAVDATITKPEAVEVAAGQIEGFTAAGEDGAVDETQDILQQPSFTRRIASGFSDATEGALTGLLAAAGPVAPGGNTSSEEGFGQGYGAAMSSYGKSLVGMSPRPSSSSSGPGISAPIGIAAMQSEEQPALTARSVTCKLRDAFVEDPDVTAVIARRTRERDADVVGVNEKELFTPQVLPQSFLDRYGLDASSLEGIGIGGLFGREKKRRTSSSKRRSKAKAAAAQEQGLSVGVPPQRGAALTSDSFDDEASAALLATRVARRQKSYGSVYSPPVDPSCGRHVPKSSSEGAALPETSITALRGVASGAFVPPIADVLGVASEKTHSRPAKRMQFPYRPRGLSGSTKSLSSFVSCKTAVDAAEVPGAPLLGETQSAARQPPGAMTTAPFAFVPATPPNTPLDPPASGVSAAEGFKGVSAPNVASLLLQQQQKEEDKQQLQQLQQQQQQQSDVGIRASGQPSQPSLAQAQRHMPRPSIDLQRLQPTPEDLQQTVVVASAAVNGASAAVTLVRTPPVVCATPDGTDARKPSALCADEVVVREVSAAFCSPFLRWASRHPPSGERQPHQEGQPSQPTQPSLPQLSAAPLTFVSPAAAVGMPQVPSIPSSMGRTADTATTTHAPQRSAATRSEVADSDALSIGSSGLVSARSHGAAPSGNVARVEAALLSPRSGGSSPPRGKRFTGANSGMPLSAPATAVGFPSFSPAASVALPGILEGNSRQPSEGSRPSSSATIPSPQEMATAFGGGFQSLRAAHQSQVNRKVGERAPAPTSIAAAMISPRSIQSTAPTPSAVAASLLVPKILWPQGGYGPLNPACERNCSVCKARGRLRFVGSRASQLKLDLRVSNVDPTTHHYHELSIPEGEGLVSGMRVGVAPVVRGDSQMSTLSEEDEAGSSSESSSSSSSSSSSYQLLGRIAVPCPSTSPSGVALAPPLPSATETEDVVSKALKTQAQVRRLAEKASALTPSGPSPITPAQPTTSGSGASSSGASGFSLLWSVFGGGGKRGGRTESAPAFTTDSNEEGKQEEEAVAALAPLDSTSSAAFAPPTTAIAEDVAPAAAAGGGAGAGGVLDPRVAIGPGSALAATQDHSRSLTAYSAPVGISVSGRGYLKKRERGSYLTIAAISLAAEAPSHHASDGFTDLLVIRTGSKKAVFNVLSSYALKGLSSVYNKTALVEYAKARTVVITPDPGQEDVVLCLDGEVFASPAPYYIHVLPSLLTVFGEW